MFHLFHLFVECEWHYGCVGIWLCGHLVVWAFGCVGIWLCGHLVVWAFGCSWVANTTFLYIVSHRIGCSFEKFVLSLKGKVGTFCNKKEKRKKWKEKDKKERKKWKKAKKERKKMKRKEQKRKEKDWIIPRFYSPFYMLFSLLTHKQRIILSHASLVTFHFLIMFHLCQRIVLSYLCICSTCVKESSCQNHLVISMCQRIILSYLCIFIIV